MARKRIPFEEQKPMGRPANTEPNAKITVILPELLKHKISELAKQSELSLSNYLCRFLSEHFREVKS